MYIHKKTPKKRLTPVRASKKKANQIKRLFLFLLIIILCFFIYVGIKQIASMAFALERPSWLQWRLKKINIYGAEGDIRYEVSKYIAFDEGDVVTGADVEAMEELIAGSLKQVESIKAHRNLFTKELNIKIKRTPAVAEIIEDNKTFYVNKDGLIFKDEALPEYDKLVPVMVFGKISDGVLPQEIVELFKELNNAKNTKIKEAYLDLDERVFDIVLEDLTRVHMGDFFDTTAKLNNLTAVIDEADKKNFKKPYNISLKYFKNGKIYFKN